jgi:hypothetical protein
LSFIAGEKDGARRHQEGPGRLKTLRLVSLHSRKDRDNGNNLNM